MEILRDASVSMERSLFQEDITPVQLHLSARSKDDSLSDKSSSRYDYVEPSFCRRLDVFNRNFISRDYSIEK